MTHMVIRADNIAMRVEELRERVIAPDVLCNAMDNLDDSLRLCLRRPDAAMQLPSPRRVQKKFFHT